MAVESSYYTSTEEVEYVVETYDLVKIYKEGNVKAVDGLNLKIKSGEIYAFIGANGSGKSTTINMITGVLEPTRGEIKIMGMDLKKHRHYLSYFIGVAPQEYSVFMDLTVEENIKYFGTMYGLKKQVLEQRITELLDVLKLSEKRKTMVRNLSGGMKRRVSIACALVHNPKLVFFDEATVGVDPVLKAFFWDYFRSLRDKGITLVITSHVMEEAERADRIGLIRAGKLIEEDTPANLKKKYNAKSVEEVFLLLSGGEFIDS